MHFEEPIEITLHQKFRREKLRRFINECDDISVLKEIAFELLTLNQQKTTIAEWSTRIALQNDQIKLKRKNLD